jgi:DNA-binding response OmpR family regulator
MPARILIVDDQAELLLTLQACLEQEGFDCVTATDGIIGLRLARLERPDLVVLDLVLPGLNGHDVCRRLRGERATEHVPIIMMTGIGNQVDRIVGLELGADDFLTKPFELRELVARVKAVLRRARRGADSAAVRVGTLEVDAAQRRVSVAGAPVDLTATEFDLLAALVGGTGRVLTRAELLEELWGAGHAAGIASRAVDFHVSRLRGKLGPEGARIMTVRGVGYRFDPTE